MEISTKHVLIEELARQAHWNILLRESGKKTFPHATKEELFDLVREQILAETTDERNIFTMDASNFKEQCRLCTNC